MTAPSEQSPDSTPPLLLSRAHYPVKTLGFGQRAGIWTQGCSIRCKGCVSKDTWPADPDKAARPEDVAGWCLQFARPPLPGQPPRALDGATVSGGEPFDQPEALYRLLSLLREGFIRLGLEADLLAYSGFPLKTLRERHGRILQLLDAVVSEPYIEERPGTHPLAGSANQILTPLTPLGAARYGADGSCPGFPSKSLQTHFDGKKLWLIGIPGRGDMEKFSAECAKNGIRLEGASWL